MKAPQKNRNGAARGRRSRLARRYSGPPDDAAHTAPWHAERSHAVATTAVSQHSRTMPAARRFHARAGRVWVLVDAACRSATASAVGRTGSPSCHATDCAWRLLAGGSPQGAGTLQGSPQGAGNFPFPAAGACSRWGMSRPSDLLDWREADSACSWELQVT
eukprot:366560-Chlamydomonas_euryale.AAC.6